MPERDPWPWPGESATERARRIANSLLALLPDGERDIAIRKARAVGETWLGEHLLRWTNDDVITTDQAADLIHMRPSTIRKWHSRGQLCNRGEGVTWWPMCWTAPPTSAGAGVR
jgi:hypothetical protein